MGEIVPDESRKRRLPLWMLGVAAADHVRKSENKDVNNDNTEEGIASQCRQPKLKARTAQHEKEVLPSDKESLKVESSSLLLKCIAKQRKGKLSGQDAGYDVNIHERGSDKRKRGGGGKTVREAAPRERRKAKSYEFESCEEIEVSVPNDDLDLTMEDLMNIAKEYVKDDKDVGQQESSDGEHKAENQFPTVSLSRNESGGFLNAPQSNMRSPTHIEAASCHDLAENRKSEGITINPSMTGDPTQDMLDLFLGPLLKKPLEEEKKVDLIVEDMTFAYEFQKQNECVLLGEELVPLTKKKTSLKEKVAMFLD